MSRRPVGEWERLAAILKRLSRHHWTDLEIAQAADLLLCEDEDDTRDVVLLLQAYHEAAPP